MNILKKVFNVLEVPANVIGLHISTFGVGAGPYFYVIIVLLGWLSILAVIIFLQIWTIGFIWAFILTYQDNNINRIKGTAERVAARIGIASGLNWIYVVLYYIHYRKLFAAEEKAKEYRMSKSKQEVKESS